MKKKFIVAEVAKTWENGAEIDGGLLCQRFENVIAVNLDRGYRLSSWHAHAAVMATPDVVRVTETIIAVFEKID